MAVQAITIDVAFLRPTDLKPEVSRRRRSKSPSLEAQRAEQVRQQPLAAAQALVVSLEERIPLEERAAGDVVDSMLRAGDFDRSSIEQNRALLAEGLLATIFQHVRAIIREEVQPGFLSLAAERVEAVAA